MNTFNNTQPYNYGNTLISITGDARVAEGGTANYTVSLTGPLDNTLVVDIIYTLKDVDKGEIIEETKEVYFYPGETEVSFTVRNVDDDIYEGEEVYNVGIGGYQEIVPMSGMISSYNSYTLVQVDPKKQNVDTVIVDNEKNPTPEEPTPTPEANNDVVYLSEEGLKGGLKDDKGTQDLTNLAVQSGALAITGATAVTFADAQPSKIGETDVKWDGVNTANLTAYQDKNNNGVLDKGEEVLQATIDNQGNYKVSLLDAIKHSNTETEDVAKIDLAVTAKNVTKSVNSNLSIVIEDDSPEITADSVDIAVPPIDVNLMLVLDTSTSMGSADGEGYITVNGQQMTRLDAVKIACKSAIEKYQEYGDVKVRLVTFASTAKKVGDTWVSAEEALAQIDAMQAGGFTNYDDALVKAEDAFKDEGKIDNGINRSIFITDGAPTAWVDDNGNYGHEVTRSWWNWWLPKKDESDKGIQQDEQAKWEQFIEENDINSWAVTLESSDATNTLDGIAHNGAEDDTQRNGEYVNPTELKEYLLNGIDANVTATNLVGKFGGDDGYVKTVIIDGVTYDYNVNTGDVSIDGSHANVIKFDKENARLTLKTAKNGELTINFDDGTYDYQASKVVTESYKETLTFTIKDN
nr:VWA domain-containing protein [Moraxellaceae bacterium]